MTLHRNGGVLSVANRIFNARLRKDCCIIENAFGILKQTFKELLVKSDLYVAFLPDVILACAILHNMLLGQSHKQVKNLLHVLRSKGLAREDEDEAAVGPQAANGLAKISEVVGAINKCNEIGVYLTIQRQMQR